MNTLPPLARLSDDLGRLVRHEARALAGHRAALRERWQVARRTRTAAELLRHQIDLLPLTARQLADDHRRRLALLRRLSRRLARTRPA